MTDLAELLLLAVFGRILIYLWMEFPLPKGVDSSKFIHGLHSCDLCSGVWIYAGLFLVFGVDVLQMLGIPQEVRVWGLDEALGGAIISFVVHLVRLGWVSRFESIIIK